ncbi:MAG: glycosyltransferase family 2 protein [Thiobacillus sp.]
MPRISVIIPTHNRPGLLREALACIRNQTFSDWEIVIVDDGSQPPVDTELLRRDFGTQLKILRNDKPLKQPYARNQGVQAATGDVVVHLDDDDLLAPHALEAGLAVLERDHALELVYLGVKGFGEGAIHFDASQQQAMQAVLSRSNASGNQSGVIRFGTELFPALLYSVPMAFQRSIEYRTTWNKVSALRRRAYMLDPDIDDEEQAMRRLRPPLRESEWALYAAACCKTALLLDPVYLQRCEKQGYYSVASQRERAILSMIDIKSHLLGAAKEFTELSSWKSAIRKSLSLAYFSQSYFNFRNSRRVAAYGALFNALKIRPTLSYLKFGVRLLLPGGNMPD